MARDPEAVADIAETVGLKVWLILVQVWPLPAVPPLPLALTRTALAMARSVYMCVRLVKRMPVLTNNTKSPHHPATRVLCLRHSFQMRRTNTIYNPTKMIPVHTWASVTDQKRMRTNSAPTSSAETESSITPGLPATNPQPAGLGLLHFRPKPLFCGNPFPQRRTMSTPALVVQRAPTTLTRQTNATGNATLGGHRESNLSDVMGRDVSASPPLSMYEVFYHAA